MAGGHACQAFPRQILRDTVNERAVRILWNAFLFYNAILFIDTVHNTSQLIFANKDGIFGDNF